MPCYARSLLPRLQMVSQRKESDRLLIVEDDELGRRTLERFFRGSVEVVAVGTGQEGLAALASHKRWVGAVLDWRLPDTDGLTLLGQIREAWPTMPILLATAHMDAACANRVHVLRAEYVVKPIALANLEAFLRRIMDVTSTPTLLRVIGEISKQKGFSRAEQEVVEAIANGVLRAEVGAYLGITENSVKTLVRRLLAKFGGTSLDQVIHEANRRCATSPDPARLSVPASG